ncbi:glycosyltransferase [Moheibacter sediminis]|uniref:Glycosyltransferase involved in cell wall bisynthesis n=1 Tax=Moheibacter sediminis TaxID=1434700 RepID=A0A1W2BAR6_9FLAO|nr:glycosyltransferase [Moheibacter sediminis]SMC69934.1 Glycosyltransferase involved in cell wall bisynthesis [Moheibacter sediminis]
MKNLVFATEARFTKDSQGNIYGDASFSHSLWERYLKVFDRIFVIARVNTDANFKGDFLFLSNSENVIFIEVPYYIGPLEYLKKRKIIKKIIKKNVEKLKDESKFICRIPGQISDLVIDVLNKNKKKYALEVVGDPDDVFAPGTIKHPLRRYFRNKMVKSMENNIRNASGVLYVTKNTLQSKYPVKEGTFTTYASNVQLNSSETIEVPKKWQSKNTINITSIGSLEQMYKAPDVVLEAIKIVNENKKEIEINLLWMGDGKFKDNMIELAKELGIEQNIDFIGNVNKQQVFEHLSNSDIFILASRTEGLPRAIIEAMSIGLPVIGTNVGGIPELIEDSVLVEKNNAIALAEKIEEVISNQVFYNQQAARNFEEAKNYKDEFLAVKRFEFYSFINDNL